MSCKSDRAYADYFGPLIHLNANRARIAALDIQIKRCRELARQLENDVSYRGSVYGEEYRHPDGSHSDPTGRDAVRDVPDDVMQLYEDIRGMIVERQRTATLVDLAEQALAFLPDRQRVIVIARCVDDLSWDGVADALVDQTGELVSLTTCRTEYERAALKIIPFFRAFPDSFAMAAAEADAMNITKKSRSTGRQRDNQGGASNRRRVKAGPLKR